MTVVRGPTLLGGNTETIPISVSLRHCAGPRMRRLVARRGVTPPQKLQTRGLGESNIRSETICTSTVTKITPYGPYFDIVDIFEKSTRLPLLPRPFFVVLFSPFATLADPAADIADRELRYSNQPSKLEHPSSPSSMAPLPASSARMALRQTPYVSSARLSQVQRHFSTTSPVRKEIQDAYILSAARTPTGKVRTAS
jgi:hypothetical protein